ncbi:MAG: YggT family protein [Caldilineaceae bacterium]|nr:YggT family protein [Caldilineaceae bacterium]MBP8107707.1 YggT family protein [Caldilineaceae bacterium]MBP8122874.1 YggT family protein [Caldilineaceae bacterium]MBP9071268.1 YggT family protein [Caldilineaceae bacterium]
MNIFGLLAFLLQIYTFAIFARIILTWIPGLDPYHPAVQMLARITDPVLEPARRIIPPIGMIDISPIVVLLVLSFIQNFLEQSARGG